MSKAVTEELEPIKIIPFEQARLNIINGLKVKGEPKKSPFIGDSSA